MSAVQGRLERVKYLPIKDLKYVLIHLSFKNQDQTILIAFKNVSET